MNWNPIVFVKGLSRSGRERQRMARRWGLAFETDAKLVDDLVRLGLLIEPEPGYFRAPDGQAPSEPTAIDLAMRAGRRELALELLALGRISPTAFVNILEENNEHD
ncbi:MAG: hypothetical protein AAFY65_01330 [Pseudomonadota bacterium]